MPGAICLSEDAYRQVKAAARPRSHTISARRGSRTSPRRCASFRWRSTSPASNLGGEAGAASAYLFPAVAALGALILNCGCHRVVSKGEQTRGDRRFLRRIGAGGSFRRADCRNPAVRKRDRRPAIGDARSAHRPENEGRSKRAALWRIVGRTGGTGSVADPTEARQQIERRLCRHRQPGGRRGRAARHIPAQRRTFGCAPLVADDFAPLLEKLNAAAVREAEIAGHARLLAEPNTAPGRARLRQQRNRENDVGLRSSGLRDLWQARPGRGARDLPGSGGAKRALEPQCLGGARHRHAATEDLWLGTAA